MGYFFLNWYKIFHLNVKLNGFGTVGCHLSGLWGGKLFVSKLFPRSLSTLSGLFDSLSVLQDLLAEWILEF